MEVELWKLLTGASDAAVFGILFILWKIDRRLVKLESELEHHKTRIDLLHNERHTPSELLHGLGVAPRSDK